MAHRAGLPRRFQEGQLTRRQLIQGLTLTAAATTIAHNSEAAQAQAGDASAKVRATLETLVRDTPEIGLQVAAYLDGKLVVDAWAGMADEATKKAVDGDTMFMLSSTTKGVTSTCMHVCVEKHKLDYDMPIVKVWPEFGANGKGDATLRHALCHRTGVPQTPVGYTPDWLPDWDRMCRGIAELKPMYPIGERTAYHSLNFGYINGEILRRVDGRSIAQFLQEEICKPLGINGLYLGVPDSELRRVAVLTDAPPAPADYDARMVGEPAGSYVAKVFNRPEVQKASIPASGGIMSARGLARHYAMLANWGELGWRAHHPRGSHSRRYRAAKLRVGRGLPRARAALPRLSPRQRHRTAGFPGRVWPCRRRRFLRVRGSIQAPGHRLREELFHLRHGRRGEPGTAGALRLERGHRSRV